MAGRFVFLGVVVIAPQGCGQAVTELGAVLEASIGRAVEGLKDLQVVQCGHMGSLQRLASYSVDACLPACRQTKAQVYASAPGHGAGHWAPIEEP
ncbi:hypothetical protein D3C78_1776740 [compost metagenome]